MLVIEAIDGGPDEAAGVKPNDVIIKLDSQSIREVPQLPKIIRGSVPGRTGRLTVLRGKERVQVPVTLGQLPEAMWAQSARESGSAPRRIGGSPAAVVEEG